MVAVLISIPGCAAAQSASAGFTPTIRTTTNLVVVDVVATDAQQKPIQHLTASDFTILEDGHPQTIQAFEEHASGSPELLPPVPKLAPGNFTNYSAVPVNGALNILLLDKLNTPMDAQGVVRDQVLKYLKGAPAGTRIAIFALGTQLRLLQGFTSDPAVLRALVEGKKGLPGSSPLMTNSVSGDEPGADDAMMDTASDALGNTPDAATVMANLQQFEAQQQSFQFMLRARYTLDALNQMARYLSSLPGRKNLIWFSGSFPLSVLPDGDLQNPFSVVASAEEEYRETVDLLVRSQVAVYPIDARGLMTAPMLSAANSDSRYVRDPAALGKDEGSFFRQTTAEQSTMKQMAAATGGEAFVNTNDLKAAISKAIEAGSNYYTIAYTPTDQNSNGDYRKIEVKLKREGTKLAYRRGYYADGGTGDGHENQAKNSNTGPAPYSAMHTAMLYGAPDPAEIVFIANVRPSGGDKEPAPAAGNQVAAKTSGPYRRYTVTFITNPKDLNCAETPDGEHHCAVEFLTFVYDADGALVNAQTDGIKANFMPAHYASFLKSPLVYRQQISVPVKGEYHLRVGLHDDNSDRVGALDVPIAAVAELAPIPAAATAAGKGSRAAPK
ncbi:MAG TPA: VWA domain-containing protein [Terracidiphilus sp.]